MKNNHIANGPGAARYFFDVSGLIQWFAYESTPSGIQRVSVQILQAAIARSPENVHLIARCPGSARFFPVSRQFVSELAGTFRQEAIEGLRRLFVEGMRPVHPILFLRQARTGHIPYAFLGMARFLKTAMAKGSPTGRCTAGAPVPSAGDVIVGLGDFWCHREHAKALVDLKKKSGATLFHMIHDLFALARPEWTHPYYGPEFAEQFAVLARHVDHWLTNSNFVKSQVHSYLETHGIAKRVIDVVPMGWDSFRRGPTSSDIQHVLGKHGLAAGKYILHVGTVEPRKNLVPLIDAIFRLRRELGDNAPTCVLVGREGWRSSEVQRHLGRTSFADGAIRWIRNADDADLPSIYRGARFTVMPSLAEGWGLPVQESLAFGVPCIASNAGGLPEAGLDLARYVSPLNGIELFAAIKHWSTDDQALDSAREMIRHRLRLQPSYPTWDDAAGTVLAAGRSLPDSHQIPGHQPGDYVADEWEGLRRRTEAPAMLHPSITDPTASRLEMDDRWQQ